MIVALFMGCGPGIYLINPDPGDPDALRFLFGMPLVWLWASFWCMVEGLVVVVAYFTLWRGDPT